MSLDRLVDERSIVVCCGTGGVGKTTTAAAMALEAARRGRRVVVVTIDPAKRLADALGVSGGLTNTATRIEGPWPGELWGVMLDTRTTFDELVRKQAGTPEQAERILGNTFYRNISGALSGTQEYMAMEKLYELHEESDFELVVVDTPPTRRALDFLDAPQRLTRFLDHRLYRVLLVPTRAYLKAVNLAAQAFLRTVSRVVGGEVIDDAVAFFQAFDGMEQGFRQRAGRVLELLSSPDTSFVLVAAPRDDTLAEARFFAAKLAEGGIAVDAVVVNRVHPRFSDEAAGALRARAVQAARGPGRIGSADAGEPAGPAGLAGLLTNLADLTAVTEREEEHLAELAEELAAPVIRVPFLARDVHDVDGLTELGSYLFGRG